MTQDQLAAVKAFAPHVLFGAAWYAFVLGLAMRFSPPRRYRVRVIGMLIVMLTWYAYYLPDIADASGQSWGGWGPGGGRPRVFGDRLGIHTIWAWVIAAIVFQQRSSRENAGGPHGPPNTGAEDPLANSGGSCGPPLVS